MTRNVRKSGIPALAYTPSNAASPLLLSMMFRYNESAASVLLQSSLVVAGYDDAQTFVLQYDADNMKPGHISVGPATIPLPQSRLDQVARDGSPQIQTLSLTLKRVANLWCSHSDSTGLQPRSGHETAFTQLAQLAKATCLHVLFDFNWLHRDHHAAFQRLVDHPNELTGFPVWRHYSKHFRRETWTIFAEEGSVHVGPEHLALVGEQPPVYAESSKRPRDVTPTPSSPTAKRTLLSPFPETYPSPTEKDSTSTSSPKQPLSSVPHSPILQPHDTNRLPPTASPCQSPSLAKPATPVLPPPAPITVDLPTLEQTLSVLLPTLLPRILMAESPSPTPSFTSLNSCTSIPPAPANLNALGVSLADHMTRHVSHSLSTLYANTIQHANHLRAEADVSFTEACEGERSLLAREAEERVEEFEALLVERSEEEGERFVGMLEELGEGVVGRVERRVEGLRGEEEQLSEVVEGLRAEKRGLKGQVARLERRKVELRRDIKDLRRLRRELRRQTDALCTARSAAEGVIVDANAGPDGNIAGTEDLDTTEDEDLLA